MTDQKKVIPSSNHSLYVMGILNNTPDSFYDGGKYNNTDQLKTQVGKLIKDGADIIDIGGYSSRPGALEVSLQEELDRVIPAIEIIRSINPETHISIDTFRAKVAEECLKTGADIINDISAGNLDIEMYEVIAKYDCTYIAMHMRGNPQNMQNQENTTYNNIIEDMIDYFDKKIVALKNLNINKIIIDPGFGFSKTLDQNYVILNSL